MASKKSTAITVTVPAEQAEDFRLAAVALLTETADWIKREQKYLEEVEGDDDPKKIKMAQGDLAGARKHLPPLADVLGKAVAGEAEIVGDACALGFVCAEIAEQMIDQLKELRQYSAFSAASDMLPRAERLMWALEHTARSKAVMGVDG